MTGITMSLRLTTSRLADLLYKLGLTCLTQLDERLEEQLNLLQLLGHNKMRASRAQLFMHSLLIVGNLAALGPLQFYEDWQTLHIGQPPGIINKQFQVRPAPLCAKLFQAALVTDMPGSLVGAVMQDGIDRQ